MKILHIIDSGGLYGAEVMLLNLMSAQLAMGLEPVLVSIGTPGCPPKFIEVRAREKGLRVLPWRMRAGLNFRGARSLCRLAREEGASLFHSHGYKGNILLGLLPFIGRTIPVVTTLHGWTWTGRFNRMMLYEWLDALSLRRVDHVVVVSQQMLRYRRLESLPSRHRSVIPNGIDYSACDKQEEAALPPADLAFIAKRFTVVAVGRLSPEKGFSLLIDAIGELVLEGCDLQLLLLGEGGLRENLTAQASAMGIADRVRLPGYVEQVPLYLRQCQLFAMPSLTEGLPMALLEAMFTKIPILASRVGGIPEALMDGKAGLLVEPGQQEQLKQAIRLVYDLPNDSSEMVQRAKQHVQAEYSAWSMAERYRDIYEFVTASPS